MQRIVAATKKEFLQFSRDRMLILLILWTYTIEVVLCTYALSFDVTNLRLIVYDQDRSQTSQRVIEKFTESEYFGETFLVSDPEEINNLLDAGKADIGIVIPPDFSERLKEGRTADIQIILSGTNSNTANIARNYAISIINSFSLDVIVNDLAAEGVLTSVPAIEPEIRIWYNSELEFRYFMVISMIVVAGVLVGIVHIAATMVREKETGTVDQLIVTPLKKYEIIISKIVPTMTVGLLALIPSLLIALWFKVPIRGSLLLFFVTSAVALFSSMGIGVYISTISGNLQQALLIAFFVLFPLMFLSGTLVPIESMPLALQYLSYLSPVRYYMEITLGIFLKANGLTILWPKLITLFAIGILLFSFSLYRLGKKMYA
ncbi:MAG: ABC transporter permease [Ectothiorhodospiraceae bacterium]|nr:ABC transporter permease [Ectothiorhodospiraceae bacterium]